MFFALIFIGGFSIFELIVGAGLLSLLFYPLRKTNWPLRSKRSLLIALGTILISPALAPAGSMALMPLPLGVLLAFIRRAEDVAFLFHTFWFLIPSMIVTGLIFGCIARRLFPSR